MILIVFMGKILVSSVKVAQRVRGRSRSLHCLQLQVLTTSWKLNVLPLLEVERKKRRRDRDTERGKKGRGREGGKNIEKYLFYFLRTDLFL